MTEWLIALAVCTLYGWIMHYRGFMSGKNKTANWIVDALVDSGMELPKITNIFLRYNEKLQRQKQDADGSRNDEE